MSSESPEKVMPVLKEIVKNGIVTTEGRDISVEAEMEGEDVKDLNRIILSSLRRVEKKTRLRAVWTASDGTRYRFFDYVLKKTEKM